MCVGTVWREKTPALEDGTETWKILEILPSRVRIDMHHRQIGPGHKRQFQGVDQRDVAVGREVCRVEDRLERQCPVR